MSALDIGARGLAARALQRISDNDDGTVSIASRTAPTAVALEELAAQHGALEGRAGEIHTVETAPYITQQRLLIRGNGAELRNTWPYSLDNGDIPGAALPLGVSNVWDTDSLTYYPVLSANGPVLSVAEGEETNFAPGDLVVMHGATSFHNAYAGFNVYRNYLRARVIAVEAGLVTLDRGLPSQLIADAPVIANADAGVPSLIPGAPRYYLLYAPHVSGLTLSSDLGEAWKWGGIIDGTFRDLEIVGRNGVVFNALQDCLFENIRFRSWRKICELAEGSYGTVVRGLRGTLSDSSERLGGASDAPTFFIALGESCAECVLEDFSVDSGPNDIVGHSGVTLSTGRNNEMRNSQLRFPALTATVLRIQSYPAPGHPNVDCGFRRLTVTAPVCSQFFTCNELGGGLERPFLENSRFYGQPTLGAATLAGKDGRLTDNFFESGDVHTGAANAQGWRIERNTVNGAMICWTATNQIIRENYIRDGFSGLTDAFLGTNTVADNESDASRRLCAASVVVRTHQNITTTTPNSVYASASFAAGDLTPRDRIFISAKAKASWSATSNAFARVSITQDNVTTAIASLSSATPGAPLSIRGFLELNTDSALICELMIGEKLLQNALTTSSIAARGLTVKVEFWVSNPGEPINVRGARIVAVKPGMKHLPIE